MTSADAFEVLTTPVPALEVQQAQNILHETWGITGTLKPLASERDQNFLVSATDNKRYVFKVANSAEDPAVTDFQTGALLHIAHGKTAQSKTGLAVPRVIRTVDGETEISVAATDGRQHIVRVLTWLDGIPAQHAERAPNFADALGICLAELGQALRDYEHSASGYALLWDLKGASALRQLLDCVVDDDLRRLCEQRLGVFDSTVAPRFDQIRWQAVHNDLNPGNVLVEPTNSSRVTGIIDFGDLVRSPLIVDVAVAAAYLLREDGDILADIKKFIAAYSRVEALLPTEIELLIDLILTRSTMTVLITHWRAARYPENREYILRSEARARNMLNSINSDSTIRITEDFRDACGL